jgi:hypothetical protein
VLADAPSVTRAALCVAAGCEITELLVIAKETVKPHIGRVLTVLDVRGSRVSRWSVMEAVLVLAITLFLGVPTKTRTPLLRCTAIRCSSFMSRAAECVRSSYGTSLA